jgi:hypothetical protein
MLKTITSGTITLETDGILVRRNGLEFPIARAIKDLEQAADHATGEERVDLLTAAHLLDARRVPAPKRLRKPAPGSYRDLAKALRPNRHGELL